MIVGPSKTCYKPFSDVNVMTFCLKYMYMCMLYLVKHIHVHVLYAYVHVHVGWINGWVEWIGMKQTDKLGL